MNIQQPTTNPNPRAAACDPTTFKHLRVSYTDIVFEGGRNRAYYGILCFALMMSSIPTLMPWNYLRPFNIAGVLLLPLFFLQLACIIGLQQRLLSFYNYPTFSSPTGFLETINPWYTEATQEARQNNHQYNHPIRIIILQAFTLLPVTSLCYWNCIPSTDLTPFIDSLRATILIVDLLRIIGTANTITYHFIQDCMNWYRLYYKKCVINIDMGDFITMCQQNIQ